MHICIHKPCAYESESDNMDTGDDGPSSANSMLMSSFTKQGVSDAEIRQVSANRPVSQWFFPWRIAAEHRKLAHGL